MELVGFTEIFKHILPTLKKEEAEEKIRQLEFSLTTSEWCHDRIRFLRGSDAHAWDVAAGCHEIGSYQISIQQMEKIARVGLVEAWQDGVVSAKEIGAFADDIASLQAFNSVCLMASELAPVWKDYFKTNTTFDPIDIDEILEQVRKSKSSPSEGE